MLICCNKNTHYHNPLWLAAVRNDIRLSSWRSPQRHTTWVSTKKEPLNIRAKIVRVSCFSFFWTVSLRVSRMCLEFKYPFVKKKHLWNVYLGYWEFCSETSRLAATALQIWGVHNFHFQGVIPNHSALQSIHNFPTSPVFRSRSLKLRLHYLWTNNKPYLIFSPSMEVALTFLYKHSAQRHATVGWSTKASYVEWRCWGG